MIKILTSKLRAHKTHLYNIIANTVSDNNWLSVPFIPLFQLALKNIKLHPGNQFKVHDCVLNESTEKVKIYLDGTSQAKLLWWEQVSIKVPTKTRHWWWTSHVDKPIKVAARK